MSPMRQFYRQTECVDLSSGAGRVELRVEADLSDLPKEEREWLIELLGKMRALSQTALLATHHPGDDIPVTLGDAEVPVEKDLLDVAGGGRGRPRVLARSEVPRLTDLIRAALPRLAHDSFNILDVRTAVGEIDQNHGARFSAGSFAQAIRKLRERGEIKVLKKGRPGVSSIYGVVGSGDEEESDRSDQEEFSAPPPSEGRVPFIGGRVQWVGDGVEKKPVGEISSIRSTDVSGHSVRVRTKTGRIRLCPLPANDDRWSIV